MIDEAAPARRARGQTLDELSREDLELYGADELEARIAALQTEIDRVQAALGKKRSGRQAADALFSIG